MARKMYNGPLADVSFDVEICQHAGECVRGYPEVFEVGRRPWIQSGYADTLNKAAYLGEVIGRCPSGALRYYPHLDEPKEEFAIANDTEPEFDK